MSRLKEQFINKWILLLSISIVWLITFNVIDNNLLVSSKTLSAMLMLQRTSVMRFCYQPGDPPAQQVAPISSQCVYCNKNMFDYTLLQCTGLSAVTQNINTSQAFCIITQCLEQIRDQMPVLLG